MCLRPHSAGSTIPRLRPTGSSLGIAPVDYDPVVLLKPFGPRLAAGALPSRASSLVAAGGRPPLQTIVEGGSRSAFPCPGFRRRASLASPYLPSTLAGEALPPPSDIGPGPRTEWDFNPPDTPAARHTLRTRPSLRLALVLGSSWVCPLEVSLGIEATGSHVPHKSLSLVVCEKGCLSAQVGVRVARHA